jgi:molybdopterin-guanine dinucleotide biosynthesis protein B
MTQQARVLGIAGWSGAGKTTLLTRLLPVLVARGLRVATLKHAHHDFDVDQPGKDSWRHRESGASEVIVASSRRWVQIHELRDAGTEPSLAFLLGRLSPCDLVLVEGWRNAGHPKLEVFRPALGKPALWPADDRVLAVASDVPSPAGAPPWVDLNDIAAVADRVLRSAQSLPDLIAGP